MADEEKVFTYNNTQIEKIDYLFDDQGNLDLSDPFVEAVIPENVVEFGELAAEGIQYLNSRGSTEFISNPSNSLIYAETSEERIESAAAFSISLVGRGLDIQSNYIGADILDNTLFLDPELAVAHQEAKQDYLDTRESLQADGEYSEQDREIVSGKADILDAAFFAMSEDAEARLAAVAALDGIENEISPDELGAYLLAVDGNGNGKLEFHEDRDVIEFIRESGVFDVSEVTEIGAASIPDISSKQTGREV